MGLEDERLLGPLEDGRGEGLFVRARRLVVPLIVASPPCNCGLKTSAMVLSFQSAPAVCCSRSRVEVAEDRADAAIGQTENGKAQLFHRLKRQSLQ